MKTDAALSHAVDKDRTLYLHLIDESSILPVTIFIMTIAALSETYPEECLVMPT